jgi:integrase
MKNTQGRVFKRGDIFWCAYYLRGQEFRESTKSTDESEARKFLKQRLNETGADKIGAQTFTTPKAARLTVAQLIDALKADFALRGILSPTNECNLGRVIRDFGNYKAAQLTPDTVDNYISERLAAGAKPASVNRVTQLLGQSYKHAKRRGTLNVSPYIRHLSEDNTRSGFIEPADFARLLTFLPDDGLADFVQWSYACGMRTGETKQLTWPMVQGNELHIPAGICKNGKGRVLPLSSELLPIINRRRLAKTVKDGAGVRMIEFIFHRGGRPIGNFGKSWKRACKLAGLAGIIPHDMRRSCVRNLSQAGTPRHIAKKISGHTTDAVFERYNIVILDDVREAMEKTATRNKTAVALMPQRG